MSDHDAFRIMSRDTAGRLLFALWIFVLAIYTAPARAETSLRFEALGGKCQYGLGPDSTWRYEYGGYQTNMTTNANCSQIGASYMPFVWRAAKYGLRAAYVDFGDVVGHNTFPACEQCYFLARDSGAPVNSAEGRFQGQGGARGLTIGIAGEIPLGPFHLGAEAGAALLYTKWSVMVDEPYKDLSPGCRAHDWACANGWKVTPYIGITARLQWVTLSLRYYDEVHASRTERRDYMIGPFSGPLKTKMVGLSIPL